MGERIYYKDDPADDAASLWLSTTVGKVAIWKAPQEPKQQLRTAFRAGYLIGQRKATEAKGGE